MNPSRVILASASLLMVACTARSESTNSSRASLPNVPVSVKTSPVLASKTCGTRFLEHDLSHTTVPRLGDRTVYDSNGSGIAVGDLDQDGLSDIVLGNIGGSSSIQWNLGDFKFKSQELLNNIGLPESQTRAVSLVDVNSDGWLDIVFTHSQGGISAWLNNHKKGFTLETLNGVDFPAYMMIWDDLSGIGKLDLVTASYDALLETELKDSFLLSRGAGVVVYKRDGRQFNGRRLAKNSQSLAMALFDVNNDGKRDLIVGNDFAVPDLTFLNGKDWKRAKPFKRTTKNTMGFSSSDIDNDGKLELFATDMKPKMDDEKVIAKWITFMQKTYEKSQYSSLQRAENVMERRNDDGSFQNIAYELGLDATGWSWSAKFGDLNNDGFEDLYVVNGMIDTQNLKHLPNNELVETNRAYLNTGGTFSPQPNWNLASDSSGRGMSMTDLNNDGQLDIVVNNLGKPAQVFENQLCGGNSLQVELNWLNSSNTKGIGAKVFLNSSEGTAQLKTMQREVLSQSGYLSGNDPRIHFGITKDATIDSLEVVWSDRKRSVIEKPTANSILQISRSTK
jgi:enediyne biosynthesis protein E4